MLTQYCWQAQWLKKKVFGTQLSFCNKDQKWCVIVCMVFTGKSQWPGHMKRIWGYKDTLWNLSQNAHWEKGGCYIIQVRVFSSLLMQECMYVYESMDLFIEVTRYFRSAFSFCVCIYTCEIESNWALNGSYGPLQGVPSAMPQWGHYK